MNVGQKWGSLHFSCCVQKIKGILEKWNSPGKDNRSTKHRAPDRGVGSLVGGQGGVRYQGDLTGGGYPLTYRVTGVLLGLPCRCRAEVKLIFILGVKPGWEMALKRLRKSNSLPSMQKCYIPYYSC